MPELPEVETTIRGLCQIIGTTIINIKIHTPKLRFLIPKNILLVKKIKISNIDRKGKFIIINLRNDHSIVIHLGMSGRLILLKKNKLQLKKHDHFVIRTNADHFLIFNDPRRFGFIDYGKSKEIYSKKYLMNLGKDALSRSLSSRYFFSKIKKSTVPIKQLLLNQRIISGIGNIYASEILFDAKISPLKKGMDLNITDCNRIIKSSKIILKSAIIAGGSSLRDYVSANGILGNFQKNFRVYSKDGEKINNMKIVKISQYGRSTYYCPKIQK